MPKIKKRVGNRKIKLVSHAKFRIGNRKNGKSALHMSNLDLAAVLLNGRPRDKAKARRILDLRDAA